MAINTEQGEGGSKLTKRSGSHLDQGTGNGVQKKGPSIAQKGGKIPANVPGNKGIAGAHLIPHPSLTNKTADKSGGGLAGHDRTNPNLGKSKSGSKNDQHPNMNPKKSNSKKYLS